MADMVTLRVSAKLLDRLARAAAGDGRDRSSAIRRGIVMYCLERRTIRPDEVAAVLKKDGEED